MASFFTQFTELIIVFNRTEIMRKHPGPVKMILKTVFSMLPSPGRKRRRATSELAALVRCKENCQFPPIRCTFVSQ